jgi:hypothetical protein
MLAGIRYRVICHECSGNPHWIDAKGIWHICNVCAHGYVYTGFVAWDRILWEDLEWL